MSLFQNNLDYTLNHFLVNSKVSDFNIIRYKKNEYIIRSGDQLENFYFLLSGKIRIFQDYENGKTMLIRIFDSYTVLGDIEYFQDIPAMSSCQCVETVEILKVPYAYINRYYKDDLIFLRNILLQLSSKVLLTNEQALLNNVYSLDTRLASYLLSLVGDKNFFEIPPLTDVANHLGSSYRHLTRTIKDFIDKKILVKKNKLIKILDRKKILELSEGNVYERQINLTKKR